MADDKELVELYATWRAHPDERARARAKALFKNKASPELWQAVQSVNFRVNVKEFRGKAKAMLKSLCARTGWKEKELAAHLYALAGAAAATHLAEEPNPKDLQALVKDGELSLMGKGLTRIPAALSALTDLHTLNLSYNKIRILEPAIGELQSLQTLKLSYNELTELPAELGRLRGLEVLQVSGNSFGEFPTVIFKLTNLRELLIGWAGLAVIPDTLASLTKLERLQVTGNPAKELPGALMRPGLHIFR